jgi:hypothetical protein
VRLGILRVLSARRSLSLFLAGVICLACWQVWLTWRLLEQDRNLERYAADEVNLGFTTARTRLSSTPIPLVLYAR